MKFQISDHHLRIVSDGASWWWSCATDGIAGIRATENDAYTAATNHAVGLPTDRPRHRALGGGPPASRADQHSPIQCVAHGDPDCELCSLIYSGDVSPDGGCRECGAFAEYGMHWDTCPNRVVIDEQTTLPLRASDTDAYRDAARVLARGEHINAPCSVEPIMPEMSKLVSASFWKSSQQRTDERETQMESMDTRQGVAERAPFEGAANAPSTFDQDARDALRLSDLDLDEWIGARTVADVRATLNTLRNVADEHTRRAEAAGRLARAIYSTLGDHFAHPDATAEGDRAHGVARGI